MTAVICFRDNTSTLVLHPSYDLSLRNKIIFSSICAFLGPLFDHASHVKRFTTIGVSEGGRRAGNARNVDMS